MLVSPLRLIVGYRRSLKEDSAVEYDIRSCVQEMWQVDCPQQCLFCVPSRYHSRASRAERCPVFKVEARHVVVFMFTESGVAFLWACMTVMCRSTDANVMAGCTYLPTAQACSGSGEFLHRWLQPKSS